MNSNIEVPTRMRLLRPIPYDDLYSEEIRIAYIGTIEKR